MFLDFTDIPDEGLEFDREVELVPEGEDDAEPRVVGPVRLAGRVHRGRRGVQLEGRLEAVVGQDCSRCLEPVESPLAADLFLVLVSEAAEFGAGEQRLEAEDATLFYAERGKADLREIAREQILLNQPQKPVCGPDCAGLCPTCGVNRNRIECSCRSIEGDPRLAPLRALKKKMDGSDSDH